MRGRVQTQLTGSPALRCPMSPEASGPRQSLLSFTLQTLTQDLHCTNLCPLCDGITSRPGPPPGMPSGLPPAVGNSELDGVRPPPPPSVTDRPLPRLYYSPHTSSRNEKAFLLNGRRAQRTAGGGESLKEKSVDHLPGGKSVSGLKPIPQAFQDTLVIYRNYER